jgi:transcriptional regulator with XRE-family HTH domain
MSAEKAETLNESAAMPVSEVEQLVARRIRAVIKARGVTIEWLSKRMELSYRTLQNYLHGQHRIPAITIVVFSEHLNVSIDYLLTGFPVAWDTEILIDAMSDARKLAKQDEEGTDALPIGGFWGAVSGFYTARYIEKRLGGENPGDLLIGSELRTYLEYSARLRGEAPPD